MIELDSPKWKELPDAYNHGENIPKLLEQLQGNIAPPQLNTDEPWFSLWSSLCHQGDVYPASFAAVPYIAYIASRAPYPFAMDFFLLPASIEIIRVEKIIEVSVDLVASFDEAIKMLSALASLILEQEGLELIIEKTAKGMVFVGKGQIPEAKEIIDPQEGVVDRL